MSHDIFIYDVIGKGLFEDFVTAERIRDDLAAVKGERVLVHINSEGGDVFEGSAIFSLLSQHEAGVDIQVDGVAASIVSYIAMVGKTVTMMEGSMMMIHDPWAIVAGPASELRKKADVLDQSSDNMAGVYSKRSGEDLKTVKRFMAEETWFTPVEAVDAGFASEVKSGNIAAYSISPIWGYKNVPKPTKAVEKQGSQMSIAAMQRRLDLTRATAKR